MSDLTRDDLDVMIRDQRRASVTAKVTPVKIAEDKGVDTAHKHVDQLAFQKMFWAIVWTTTGEVYLESARYKRNELPSVNELMKENAPFGYNKNNIVKMEVYRSEHEARERADSIKHDREKTNIVEEKKEKIK